MVPALLDTDTLSEIVKLRDVVVVRRALAYTRQVGLLTFSAFTRYEVLRGYKWRAATTQLERFHVFCDEWLMHRTPPLHLLQRPSGSIVPFSVGSTLVTSQS